MWATAALRAKVLWMDQHAAPRAGKHTSAPALPRVRQIALGGMPVQRRIARWRLSSGTYACSAESTAARDAARLGGARLIDGGEADCGETDYGEALRWVNSDAAAIQGKVRTTNPPPLSDWLELRRADSAH